MPTKIPKRNEDKFKLHCPEVKWVPEDTKDKRALARYDQWKAIVYRHNQMADAANAGNLMDAAKMMRHGAGHYRAVLDHSNESDLHVSKQQMRTLMTASYNALRNCLKEHSIVGVTNDHLDLHKNHSGKDLQEKAGELIHLCRPRL